MKCCFRPDASNQESHLSMSSHAQVYAVFFSFTSSINRLCKLNISHLSPLGISRQHTHLNPSEEKLYALETVQVSIKSKTPIFIITRRAIKEAPPISATFTVSAAVYSVAFDVFWVEAAHGDYKKWQGLKVLILYILCNPLCLLILVWIFVLLFFTCAFSLLLNERRVSLFLSSPVAHGGRTKCGIFRMPLKHSKMSRNGFSKPFFVFNYDSAFHTALRATHYSRT